MWVDARVLDCLCLALGFIPTRDFARAIRCCRTWHAAGSRKTAWPSVSVEAVTNSIVHSQYNHSGCRRIAVNINRSLLRRGLQCARHSCFWSRIEDIHVWTGGYKPSGGAPPKSYDDAALRAVSTLQTVRVLNLGLSAPSDDAVHECFTYLASKLQVLLTNVPGGAVLSCLPMLVHLRSLAVKMTRLPWARSQLIGTGQGTLLARALPTLQQLRFLHYEDADVEPSLPWTVAVVGPDEELESPVEEARQVLLATSHLSRHHVLRQLSLRWKRSCLGDEPGPGLLDLTPLIQHQSASPLQLHSLQLDLRTTASARAALQALSMLVEIEWRCHGLK